MISECRDTCGYASYCAQHIRSLLSLVSCMPSWEVNSAMVMLRQQKQTVQYKFASTHLVCRRACSYKPLEQPVSQLDISFTAQGSAMWGRPVMATPGPPQHC